MGRTFAIVFTAALVGGVSGAAIGIAVDGGRGARRPAPPTSRSATCRCSRAAYHD